MRILGHAVLALALMSCGATMSVSARAAELLDTNLTIRMGADVHYHHECGISINRLEPGDPGGSVMNVPRCTYFDSTTIPDGSWIRVDSARYGNVYLPNAHYRSCVLVYQQIIVTASSARMSLVLECAMVSILLDGFEAPAS